MTKEDYEKKLKQLEVSLEEMQGSIRSMARENQSTIGMLATVSDSLANVKEEFKAFKEQAAKVQVATNNATKRF